MSFNVATTMLERCREQNSLTSLVCPDDEWRAAVTATELTPNLTREAAPAIAHEAELILPNMRGACVTVGGKVHTLFRLNGRARAPEPTRASHD